MGFNSSETKRWVHSGSKRGPTSNKLGFSFAAFMAICLCLMQAQSSKGPMPVLFRDEKDKYHLI